MEDNKNAKQELAASTIFGNKHDKHVYAKCQLEVRLNLTTKHAEHENV